jgi:hypothetical protein
MTPEDVNILAFMRSQAHNLIAPAELARRTGRLPSAISNWLRRYDDFVDDVVITQPPTPTIMWWPAVREWLIQQHIPFGEPCEKTGRHCLSCGSTIRLGELTERIQLTKSKAGQHRFRHFRHEDCQAALSSPAKNTTFTGVYQTSGGAR